jgi:hypothetical protein
MNKWKATGKSCCHVFCYISVVIKISTEAKNPPAVFGGVFIPRAALTPKSAVGLFGLRFTRGYRCDVPNGTKRYHEGKRCSFRDVLFAWMILFPRAALPLHSAQGLMELRFARGYRCDVPNGTKRYHEGRMSSLGVRPIKLIIFMSGSGR